MNCRSTIIFYSYTTPPAKHCQTHRASLTTYTQKHIHLTATSREPIPKTNSEHELPPKLLTEVDVLHVCYNK